MAEVKLTNVDTVVSQSNKSLSVDDAASLTENISNANHGDSLIFASGSWTTSPISGGGGGGGTVLGDIGIDVSELTINGVTDYIYEYGSTPTLELNIVSPQDNQVLSYDNVTGKWVNSTVVASGSGGGTVISDIGISFDDSSGDNVWEVDATPSTTAFTVQKTENNDGTIDFNFPSNPN